MALKTPLTDAQLRATALPISQIPATSGACNGCVAASLSDSVNLTNPGWIQPRLLAGTIKVTDMNDNVSSLVFELKEVSLFRVKRVWSTGTTADMGIVVLY